MSGWAFRPNILHISFFYLIDKERLSISVIENKRLTLSGCVLPKILRAAPRRIDLNLSLVFRYLIDNAGLSSFVIENKRLRALVARSYSNISLDLHFPQFTVDSHM